MEAAIGWLVQTILGSLLIDKLDAWIRQAGLGDDVERLKSEVESVEMVVGAVRGRADGNKPLGRSLARLKELLYDADDVVDELDCYRLQQQVQGVTWEDPEGMHGSQRVDERSMADAGIPSSSGPKKRSKAWDNFEITEEENGKPVKAKCKYCHKVVKCGTDKGTSVLHNHFKSKACRKKRRAPEQPPNPSSADDAMPVAVANSSSRKRMRTDEESARITAADTHTPWDKAELSNRIKKITSQLQEIRRDVRGVLKILGSDSATSSNHCRSTTSDQYLRTSSLVQRKMYGRAKEKASIIKLMTKHKSDGVTVLPIVGIAGIGKTALAQLVYNDPTVEKQFENKIWVWVSNNFDEVRLTREMLDFVSRERHKGSPQKNERHEGISSFAKLQEILKEHMEFRSKRFLLILDDVWDNMNDYRWNKLLVPLISNHVKGNVILVTTRNLFVAQRIGTLEPVKLGALANDDFWLLFKSCAYGDDNCEGHQRLSTVGRKIAEKLKGNPLAAETAGALLRMNLTIDHWSNILMNEDWKSLQLSRGIMPALKLSYDQLPYHLQQCFSYCSIFPDSYQFLGEELVCLWISQGFVKCHSSQRLEEIGQFYLTDLVNLGFFQQVEREKSSQSSQTCYAICGLMHDFARMVSLTECAIIDGLQCNKMALTIQHVSIVTDSAYNEDQNGNIPRNEKFEENLRNTVTSVRKLRTLVITGQYDSFFFQSFQDIFQKAHNLRVLQMSATSPDFKAFLCSLINPTHLRYLKGRSHRVLLCRGMTLPQVLSEFCAPQVLDVGPYNGRAIPDGINNFVSLRHLVAREGMHSSIASIGDLTSLPPSTACSELLISGVSTLPSIEYSHSDEHSESTLYIRDLHDEYFDDKILAFHNLRSLKVMIIDGCENLRSISFKAFSQLVSLKSLEIDSCDKLFSSDVLPEHTSEDMPAANCKVFPSLESLKIQSCGIVGKWLSLMLRYAPDLEELELDECPHVTALLSIEEEENNLSNLFSAREDSPSGNPVDALTGLNPISSLKRLTVINCPRLTFNGSKEGLSGFTVIEELHIEDCPEMYPSVVHKDGNDDQVNCRWLLPQSLRELRIEEYSPETLQPCFPRNLTCLKRLDVRCQSLKSLHLHSCTALEKWIIYGCQSLTTLEGLQSLGSLIYLDVINSPGLFPCLESFSRQGYELFPQLERLYSDDPSVLTTSFCKHLTSLQELKFIACNYRRVGPRLTDEQASALVLLKSLQELEFFGCNFLVDLPAGLHTLPSLKRLKIFRCKSISGLPETGLPLSLEELEISYCSKELSDQCMLLATSKLNVKIVG